MKKASTFRMLFVLTVLFSISMMAQAALAQDLPKISILATGGTHEIPDVPGIDNKIVVTGKELHARLKFFLRFIDPSKLSKLSKVWLPGVGKNVVIMGGRLHGCQTAELLVHRGRKVTIVDTGTREEIGEGLIEVFLKPYLFCINDNWPELQ